MTSPFNPTLAGQLLNKRIDDHNNLSRTIRFAILNAVNPDPNVTVEDKLRHLDPVVFQQALADVVAELVGWERGVESFIDELRNWCDDDLHEDDALL
jgi:hypothetical protein